MGRPKVVDELYLDLLNSIVGGEFPAGAKLPTEAMLVGRYGVSRSTVRNALERLKKEGRITSRQGSGSVVADRPSGSIKPFAPVQSLADLHACFECRISLEGEIAYHVALRRDDADLACFEAYVADMERAIANGEYRTHEDADFHLWLAKASRNPFFESIMVSIRPHILFGMNLSKSLSPSSFRRHAFRALDEHKALLAAIRRRDADAARQAMRVHVESSRRRVFEGE